MLMTPDFPAQRPPVIWSEPADTPEELLIAWRKILHFMTATNGLTVNGKAIYLIFLPVRSLYRSPMIPFSNLFLIPITIRNAYPILFPVS